MNLSEAAGLRQQMPPVALAVAYAMACSLAHGLLQAHYVGYCRGSWLALFSVDPSPYCALVRRSLDYLQFSPLLLVAPMMLAPNNVARAFARPDR